MTENCGVSHCHAAGRAAAGHRGPALRRRARAALDPANGEIQVQEPRHDARLLQGARADARGARPTTAGCTPATRAQLDAEGNLKITGRVKDLFKTSKGKYVAPAPIEDRLVMHARGRGLLRHRRQPRPAAGLVMLNVEAAKSAGDAARRRASSRPSLAAHLNGDQRHARPARAARLPGRDDRALDGRQRPHHADLQGQAQPRRRGLRRPLRALGRSAPAGRLALRPMTAAAPRAKVARPLGLNPRERRAGRAQSAFSGIFR